MPMKLKALIVEDNPNDAQLLVLALQEGGFTVDSLCVDDAPTYCAALESCCWDIIFSDHSMPHFSSFEALDIRNRKELNTPFIILSGTMGEDLAVEAIKAGANDYFVKGRLTRLITAVNRALQEARVREIQQKTELELEHFITTLLHDLRTPILNEQQALKRLKNSSAKALSEPQQEIVAELVQCNQLIQHRLNQVLYACKYRQHQIQLKPESTEIAPFLEALIGNTTIQSLVQEKELEILLDSAQTLPPVNIDRTEIQHVLLILLKNAINTSPPGEKIHISTEYQETYLRIDIKDNGHGVDSQNEPHLFTPYTVYTSKRSDPLDGGLDLYFARHLIEAHGGNIGYHRMDAGNLFHITIPVAASEMRLKPIAQ
jgi:signal transduction histidine kinase